MQEVWISNTFVGSVNQQQTIYNVKSEPPICKVNITSSTGMYHWNSQIEGHWPWNVTRISEDTWSNCKLRRPSSDVMHGVVKAGPFFDM